MLVADGCVKPALSPGKEFFSFDTTSFPPPSLTVKTLPPKHPYRCEGLAKKRLCRCCGKFIPKSEAVAKGEGGDVFHADCFRCGICSLSLQNGWAPTDTWVQWDPFREQLPEFMPYVCDVCDESLAILQKALGKKFC